MCISRVKFVLRLQANVDYSRSADADFIFVNKVNQFVVHLIDAVIQTRTCVQ